MEIDDLKIKYEKFIKLFHKEMDKKFNDICDKYRLSRSGYVYTHHLNLGSNYVCFIKQMARLCYGCCSETSPKEIMKEWEEIRDNITDKYCLYFLKKYYKEEYCRMRRDNMLSYSKLNLPQCNKYIPWDFVVITMLVEFRYFGLYPTENYV